MWTATVIMQLVDEGSSTSTPRCAPICRTSPSPISDVSRNVTLRHLLSHTSGIDGDNFADFGRGDDCLERYVASCALARADPPARGHDVVLQHRLLDPRPGDRGRHRPGLGRRDARAPVRLRWASPTPARFPRRRCCTAAAVGHVEPGPNAPLEVAPVWMLPRACGPMGLINSTVGDVLTFAKLHLDAGKAHDGTQLVSAENIGAMREPQVESPDRYTLGKHWGLGVILFEWDGRAVYGHDGGTIGQSSRLRIVPDADLAISLCRQRRAGTQKVYEEFSASWWPSSPGSPCPGRCSAPAEPPTSTCRSSPGPMNGCRCATTWRPRTVGSSARSR